MSCDSVLHSEHETAQDVLLHTELNLLHSELNSILGLQELFLESSFMAKLNVGLVRESTLDRVECITHVPIIRRTVISIQQTVPSTRSCMVSSSSLDSAVKFVCF